MTAATDYDFEVGDWVRVRDRFSTSMRYIIPATQGVVRKIKEDKDEVDFVEFGSHGTRTCRIADARLMTGRTASIEKHIKEIQEIPRFRSPGNRDIPDIEDGPSFAEVVVDKYIDRLKEKSKMAKKKNDETGEETAPKRSRKKAVSLEGVQPEDFFQENSKGKSVFRPGWDAKFAACLKRVANGTADSDDKRLAKAKMLLTHPKVVDSEHFQHLIELVEQAKAA